jgi:hypothetical protein
LKSNTNFEISCQKKSRTVLKDRMSQSRKLVPEFGALSVGNTIFTEQFLEGSQGHVVGPASATANAVARYSGTTGKLVKNSIVTLSDAGTLASSAGLTLSATGALALTGTSLTVSKGTVVQASSATTGVTLDTPSGQITTVSLTTAALTTQTFTVTNASVVPGSTVLCTLLYAGTFGTDGIPVVSVGNVTTGSFNVNVTNVHPTNALANFCKIHFLVV